MAALRWVFFDVGNVLLNEDPLTFFSFLRHAEAVCRARPERTYRDVLAAREAKAAAGALWPVYEVVSEVLSPAECDSLWEETAREVRGRFAELSPLIPGAREVVEQLACGFRLGLIANQGPECRAWLGKLGVLEQFEVVAFSDELGQAKPDLGLYRLGLDKAGAEPGECVMVGDRLENDILPASRLGMATVWVRWARRETKGWKPRDPRARDYLQSLDRLEARQPASPLATVIVDNLSGLDTLLDSARETLSPKNVN